MTARDGPAPDDPSDPHADVAAFPDGAAETEPAPSLTDGQRVALTNLARKQTGEEVDWINIADARALTDLGLAVRTQEGWQITPAGLSVLGPVAPNPAWRRP